MFLWLENPTLDIRALSNAVFLSIIFFYKYIFLSRRTKFLLGVERETLSPVDQMRSYLSYLEN